MIMVNHKDKSCKIIKFFLHYSITAASKKISKSSLLTLDEMSLLKIQIFNSTLYIVCILSIFIHIYF